MSSTKPVVYRVETYIVPEVNKFPVGKVLQQIDVQLANRLRIVDEAAFECNQNANTKDASINLHDEYAESGKRISGNIQKKYESININILENRANKRNTIYDEQLDNDDLEYENNKKKTIYTCEKRFNTESEFQTSVRSQNLYPVKQFERVNSLMSIDEKNECSSNTEDKISDLCYHGYKNGCTATIPPPEEISEEVFKENWLRKIKILRQREAAVTAKEADLQIRKRELFKREKKIRILERVLKDKLKQLQQQQDMQKVERKQEEMERILESGEIKESQDYSIERSNLVQVNDPSVKMEKPITVSSNSDTYEEIKQVIHSKNSLSRQFSSNLSSKPTSYSSMKYKERRKLCYDDMNSTLSADPGDSSFIRTSERFNPEVYRKPYVFTRSASERWTNKRRNTAVDTKIQSVPDIEQRSQHVIEEKVFRKLSENINATQNKATRFLNYGLVDCKPDNVPTNPLPQPHISANNEKFSHHDSEIENKLGRRKERPVSWNEETNEWLQKKRQAYNLAIERSAKKENKENLKCNIADKSTKTKKDVKNKILTIFR